MKKLKIKDADGEEYIVEEVEEETATTSDEGEGSDVEALTADEIKELKALLPQLKELVKSATDDEDNTVEEEEEVIDSCKDEEEEIEEEKITDSAASKKKVVKHTDSLESIEETNAKAWQEMMNKQLRGGRK